MAILKVLKFPDPALRKKCQSVESITPDLTRLADDLLETMYALNGIGLSAIQVGHFVRLLTADTMPLLDGKNIRYEKSSVGQYEKQVKQPIILFNPVITKQSGKVLFTEGCLSFPSYYAEVQRSAFVEVQGIDRTGQKVSIQTDGVLAVCIQHEIDHLNGKLFIDHLSPIKAEQLRQKIKKNGYPKIQPPQVS